MSAPRTTAFDDAAARVGQGADPGAETDALVAMMTLEEKLGCLQGASQRSA